MANRCFCKPAAKPPSKGCLKGMGLEKTTTVDWCTCAGRCSYFGDKPAHLLRLIFRMLKDFLHVPTPDTNAPFTAACLHPCQLPVKRDQYIEAYQSQRVLGRVMEAKSGVANSANWPLETKVTNLPRRDLARWISPSQTGLFRECLSARSTQTEMNTCRWVTMKTRRGCVCVCVFVEPPVSWDRGTPSRCGFFLF